MIDPGNPFLENHDFASLVSALEQSIHLGVAHEATHRPNFDRAVLVYQLPVEATIVVRVTGLSGGQFTEFRQGVDYTASLSRVVWQRQAASNDPQDTPLHPDPNSAFEITYRFRDVASGITDYGPGSVAGTMLRAVARELSLLYHETNEAYRRAFLDTATGAALDAVVALLGVVRNPAQRATGSVTFTRRQTTSRVVVPVGTVLEETGGRRFETTSAATFELGDAEAEATVQAQQPGSTGNIGAGAITIMPTPPAGVDAVSNPVAITGGQEPEPDDRLRERARHALERAGNATMGALEFAVRDVDGVDDVVVIDQSIDKDLALGEVRVRYAAGGSATRQSEIDDAVDDVIEVTRAAGVHVLAERAREVTISGELVVFPADDIGAGAAEAAARYTQTVAEEIDQLGIGRAMSLRKLMALVYQTPGLADVAAAQLEFDRGQDAPPGFPASGQVSDQLAVAPSERVTPGQIDPRVVSSVDAASTTPTGSLDVRLLDAGAQALSFRRLALQLRLEVRASLIHQPSSPAVPVADVVKTVSFNGTTTAKLTLTPDDLIGFDDNEHDPLTTVTVSLPGFEGVAIGTTQVQVR